MGQTDIFSCVERQCLDEVKAGADINILSNCLAGKCFIHAETDKLQECRTQVCSSADAHLQARCSAGTFDCSTLAITNPLLASARYDCRLYQCTDETDEKKRSNCVVTQCEKENDDTTQQACRDHGCEVDGFITTTPHKNKCKDAYFWSDVIEDDSAKFEAMISYCSRLGTTGTDGHKKQSNCAVDYCDPLAQSSREACLNKVCKSPKLAKLAATATAITNNCMIRVKFTI